MRRTASEVIRELEARIARLERQSHTMSKKDRARLDELQILEDQDRLTRSQNAEYEALVKEYRLTDEYKSKQKRASSDVRRAGQKVLKAIDELRDELNKMPSFKSDESYYKNLRERFEELHFSVHKEVEFITGAY